MAIDQSFLDWINNNASTINVAQAETIGMASDANGDLGFSLSPQDVADTVQASQLSASSSGSGTSGGAAAGGSSASNIGQYAQYGLAAPGIIGMVKGGNAATAANNLDSVINSQLLKSQSYVWTDYGDGDGEYTMISNAQAANMNPADVLHYYAGDENFPAGYYSNENIGGAIDADTVDNAAAQAGSKGLIGNIKNFLTTGPTSMWATAVAGAGAGLAAWGLWNSAQSGNVMGSIISGLSGVVSLAKFIMHFAFAGPQAWIAFAIAAGAMLAVALLSMLFGKSEQSPINATGTSIKAAVSSIPSWWQTLPSAAVTAMTAGLVVSGMSYNLSPNSLYSTFSVPTVQLAQGLQTATGQTVDASTLGSHIFYQAGAGPNGTDLVIVTNNNGTNSTGLEFAVDKNGYVVGKNGPATNYLPFFQPTFDKTGTLTGYTKNPGAFNAILQIPACAAIANDGSLTPQAREAALETCMRNNKDTQFVPLFN